MVELLEKEAPVFEAAEEAAEVSRAERAVDAAFDDASLDAAVAAKREYEETPGESFERELEARRAKARAARDPAVRENRIRNLVEKFDSSVDYTTHLSMFEGPLDLLLFLINKEEIEIKDVFVSQVTEQFLEYMNGLKYLDVDKVTDYLNIAATILKIKAQSLVPNVEEYEWIDEEIEEDKASLIRALEEYRLIKDETEKLKELETVGYYFKAPDKGVRSTKTVFSLDNLTLEGLMQAFSDVMSRYEEVYEEEEFREIPRDEFTVEDRILSILDLFRDEPELRFEQLFHGRVTRSEIVTTFQALLELLKHQYLNVRQADEFGQIYITFNPDSPHDWVGQEIDVYE